MKEADKRNVQCLTVLWSPVRSFEKTVVKTSKKYSAALKLCFTTLRRNHSHCIHLPNLYNHLSDLRARRV